MVRIGLKNLFRIGRSYKMDKSGPNLKVRCRKHNIITQSSGPIGIACAVKSELEAMQLFLDHKLIKAITKYTNIYIEKVKNQFQRDRDARPTDEFEIKALFGLFYLIGVLRSSRQKVSQLWDNSKGSGIEACYLMMSEKRFRFLLTFRAH